MDHPTHKAVGQALLSAVRSRGAEVLLDPACGGRQNLPLFLWDQPCNAEECCNVDALVMPNGKVKVAVEIEESDLSPTRICGKLLTFALARNHIHVNAGPSPVPVSRSAHFFQIADVSRLPQGTAKTRQLQNLANEIRGVLPFRGVSGYSLFTVEGAGDAAGIDAFITALLAVL